MEVHGEERVIISGGRCSVNTVIHEKMAEETYTTYQLLSETMKRTANVKVSDITAKVSEHLG